MRKIITDTTTEGDAEHDAVRSAPVPAQPSLAARVLKTPDAILGHHANEISGLEAHELFAYFLAPYECTSGAISDAIRDCARSVHFGFRALAADADDPEGSLFSDGDRSMFFLTICRRLDVLAELVRRMDVVARVREPGSEPNT